MAKSKEKTHLFDPKFRRLACGSKAKAPKQTTDTAAVTCSNCIWAAGLRR